MYIMTDPPLMPPPRPETNDWRSRLWDNLYGSLNEISGSSNSQGQERERSGSSLQEEVNGLVQQGENLRKLLERVEGLVGEESSGDDEILTIANSEYQKEMLFREEIDFTPCIVRRNTLEESFGGRPSKLYNYNWRRNRKVDPNKSANRRKKKFTGTDEDSHSQSQTQKKRGYAIRSPSFSWMKKLIGKV
mmetsp:Transcript_16049/g.19083  ORF Transcript_16049/g.19083 Transcript_16049/m.19083 type:complete len:190 (+) Transcript_16049:277-846(+)